VADVERLGLVRQIAGAGAAGGSRAARRSASTREREEALQAELDRERAGALGRAGRKLDAAMAALADAEAALHIDTDAAWAAYEHARQAATRSRWEMRVHREAVGLRSHGVLDELWPLPPRRRR